MHAQRPAAVRTDRPCVSVCECARAGWVAHQHHTACGTCSPAKKGALPGRLFSRFRIRYEVLSSTPQQLWPIGYSCSLLSYGPDTRGKNNYVYDKTLLQVPPALVPVPAPAPVQIRSSMYEYLSIPRYTRIMTRILFTHIHVPCGSHTTYD